MNLNLASVVLLAACCVGACAVPPATTPEVTATLQPTTGNTAAGIVRFAQDGPMVRVRGTISNLAPAREYGFHVHERGDCSSGDGMSAGAHLNPAGKPHGPPGAEHHAGDLPSVKSDASGTALVDVRVEGTVLGSGAGDFAGKALILHAQADDYTTQPTGNSGARIACGVIGTAMGRDGAGNPVVIPKDL